MRTVNATFSTAIAEGKVKVAELYIIELVDGVTIYRYTSHGEDLVWDSGSNVYTSIDIDRTPIRYTTNFEADNVKVTIGNIAGDLYDNVQNNTLDGCKVTIKRILWSDTYASDLEIILFEGFADVEFDRKTLILDVRPIADLLNIKIPKYTYQEPCNHKLFDDGCGLTQSDYEYAGTADSGSTTTLVDTTRGTVYKVDFDAGDEDNPIEIGQTVTGQTGAGTGVVVQIIYLTATTGTIWYVEQSGVQFVDDEELQNPFSDSIVCNGTPAEDIYFYELGELEMTGGDNNGLRRTILSNSSSTITVFLPFPNAIGAGDTYKIYPGCDGRAEECCLNRFNNSDNFYGYLYVPRIEETIY